MFQFLKMWVVLKIPLGIFFDLQNQGNVLPNLNKLRLKLRANVMRLLAQFAPIIYETQEHR